MSNRRKIILAPGIRSRVQRVRNQITGRVLPCCWSDCERDGDLRYKIVVREDSPDERPKAGIVNTRTYVFCSDGHREFYVQQLPLHRGY